MTSVRLWGLRLAALAPTYWLLRDGPAPLGLHHLALVVLPYGACVVALWLSPRGWLARARASRAVGTALALLVGGLVVVWCVTTDSASTRLVLVAATIVAAAALSTRILLSAVALVLVLGGLELALRARPEVLPYAVRLSLPLADRLACFFPTPAGCRAAQDLQIFPRELAFIYKPGLDVVLKHREAGWWRLETDSHGFVNRDESLYRAADVVVLGDSFAQGVLVDFEESFPQRLAASTGLRVLNLAIAGYDAWQFPRVFRTYGLPARPRVIITTLFGSNDWNARFPLYERFLAAHPEGDYLAFLDDQLARSRAPTGSLLQLPERLWEASYLVGAVRGALDPSRTGGAAETDYDVVTLGGKPVRVRLRDALKLWRGMQPEALMAAHRLGIEQLERSLAELRGMAHELGARLVVLYVPAMDEIYLPLLDASDPIWGGTAKASMLDKIARVRAVIFERAGSDLLDPTGPLQDAARRGEQLYWVHDPHWNRRGSAAVADIVARHLAAAGAP